MYLKYLSWRQCTAQQWSEETAQRWVRVTLQAWAEGEGHPQTIFVGELDGSKIMPQVFKTIFTTCLLSPRLLGGCKKCGFSSTQSEMSREAQRLEKKVKQRKVPVW